MQSDDNNLWNVLNQEEIQDEQKQKTLKIKRKTWKKRRGNGRKSWINVRWVRIDENKFTRERVKQREIISRKREKKINEERILGVWAMCMKIKNRIIKIK